MAAFEATKIIEPIPEESAETDRNIEASKNACAKLIASALTRLEQLAALGHNLPL